MKENIQTTEINFNKIYVYDSKPKIIPLLKKIFGLLLSTIILIHFISFLLFKNKISSVSNNETLTSFLNEINESYFSFSLIIFLYPLSFYIIHKNLFFDKKTNSKYIISVKFNILIMLFFVIILFGCFNFFPLLTEKFEANYKKDINFGKIKNSINLLKITNYTIIFCFFILLFLSIFKILTRPKLNQEKIIKIQKELIKLSRAKINGEEYIVDKSIYDD